MTVQQKKPIADASPQELRNYAELVLQLTVPSDAQPADIRALIAPAWPNDYIFVEQAELEPAAQTQTDQARAQAQIRILTGDSKDDPKWKIRIGSTELPGGRDPVPVGCNGVVALIQRDQIAEVPQRYIGVLRDAVRVSVTHVPESRGEFVYSNVLAYPFEVLDQPSRSEIEDWQARTRDKVLA